jgi:hypothetical protein
VTGAAPTPSIPRALVADTLGTDEAALPPGDLPLERLARRLLSYLRAGTENALPAPDHPDAWTFVLLDHLTRDHPALALAAIRAMLAACDTPEDVAFVAAGPLEDLLSAHLPALIDEVEALAASSPRFGYALTGVWKPTSAAPLLWARIETARRDVPGLDDAAPLPPADDI